MSGCPGSGMMSFAKDGLGNAADGAAGHALSRLRQWPIQLHLVSPRAPCFQGADVLMAADCVAFAMGDFHDRYLKGRSLAIACPKLDSGHEVYFEKILGLLEDAKVNSITVAIMQVPCCRGLSVLVSQALGESRRKVPVKTVTVSLQGDVLKEEWAATRA